MNPLGIRPPGATASAGRVTLLPEGFAMRRATRTKLAVAALALCLAAVPSARGDDGEDGPSYDDLLVYRGGGIGWWFTNRTALLSPSYRAGSMTEAMPARTDPAARSRVRDALLADLEAKSELVRSEAALALGRLGDPRDIETLARIVDDRDIAATRRTHRMAALGLGVLPRGDATQAARARNALLGAIDDARGKHDQYAYFWANCAYALAMRGDAAALPKLLDIRRKGLAAVDMQGSIHTDVLGPMCYSIAALGGEAALPEVREQLRGCKTPDGGSKDSAWAACQALLRVGGEDARNLLRDAARDERDDVRRAALEALGSAADAKDDASAAILRTETVDGVKGACRSTAAIALGRTGHATAKPLLLDLLESATFDVRPAVALGLGLYGRVTHDKAVTDALAKEIAKNSTNEAMSAALCLACGLAGVESARPRLAQFATDRKAPSLSTYATFALGLVGAGPEERKILHDVVGRPGDYTASREAALALGMLHDHSVVDQLRGLLSDKSAAGVGRATWAICLGRVGDDADIDFLLDVLVQSGTDEQLRACVLNAIGRLVDTSEGAAVGRVVADSLPFRLVRSGQMEAIQDLQHLID